MPRDGSGASDNAIEAGENLTHGVGKEETSKVARADKVAEMPEPEKGKALEGMNASGGGSANPTNPEGQGGRRS
ncbi:hypothetical protein NA57DRAFT_77235 [Rhizodiscina lignyota]|uniref:Uncharacterized protein n=1 Tax=Rhizodiscina lignyota TaxID=1504668 RepID=A0A9P4M4N0_9PEZI|nr:hypothetical protein NA57DRAFT_77235 [Rhizodiscina lignyota]